MKISINMPFNVKKTPYYRLLIKGIMFLSSCFFYFNIHSQDIHFSQFYAAPFYENPANTGKFNEEWRISNNFRSQQRAITDPYTTIMAGYEKLVHFYSEKFSVGAYILSDWSGMGQLSTNGAYFSVAYHKTIHKNTYHIGFHSGISYKQIEYSNLTFPGQFDMTTGYFNPEAPGGESFNEESFLYPDINFGVIWERDWPIFQSEIGGALYHFNTPKMTFLEKKIKTSLKMNVHGSLLITPFNQVEIKPIILYSQYKNLNELIFGGLFKYYFSSGHAVKKNVFVGFSHRNGVNRNSDSYILHYGLTINRISAGISHDLNASGYEQLNGERMAFELSVIFWGPEFNIMKRFLDCERY